MERKILHEITSYDIKINKNDEGFSAWHNSTLAVRSEKGLHFYELSHDVGCLDKKINCLQTFLPAAKSKATSKLFTDKVINDSIRNIDYIEMIMDQTMWPHNPQLVDEMTCVVSFEWSPHGLLPNQESGLAVLNNTGGIDLFMNDKGKWRHKFEIGSSFPQHSRKLLKQTRAFVELREAVHSVASTAMCWAPNLEGDKCCHLATAQNNGTIAFWLIMHISEGITAHLQGTATSCEGEILSMKWIPISECNFILVCANIYGQIFLFDCAITKSEVFIKDSHAIWADKDQMISRHMQFVTINDKIILICNKHRHLLLLMIDDSFNVCGQFIDNVNDYRITCITNFKDEIFITTVNSQIFKINISVQDSNLNVNIEQLEFKDASPTTELYSLNFSPNGVMCSLITVDRKINFRKEAFKINVVFATTHEKLDSLVSILMDNPTTKLNHHWDVIELLRYKCMKQKEAPNVPYNTLYEDACRDIYFLKLYLIFITFYSNLKDLCKVRTIDNIPEVSIDTIKEEILVIHAEVLFRELNRKRLAEGQLFGLDKETFLGAVNFLEYYCKKNNRALSDILNFDKSELCDSLCEYTCQSCDEQLQGFTCRNNHLNMFCSLTFTPIESFQYLACRWCNRTARIELASESPKCLICDVNLVVM